MVTSLPHHEWMLGTDQNMVIYIGGQHNTLRIRLLMIARQRRHHERAVLDLNTQLLHRRHQKVRVPFPPEHRGEHAIHPRSPDLSLIVEPATVAINAHPALTHPFRVPLGNRGQRAIRLGRQQSVQQVTRFVARRGNLGRCVSRRQRGNIPLQWVRRTRNRRLLWCVQSHAG